jgi:hypothetical protein
LFTATKDFAQAGFGNFVPVPASIPEPSTWLMLTAGFAGLGLLGYRKTRHSVVAA